MTYQIYSDPDYQHVKNEIYDRILKGEHIEEIKLDLIQRFGFKESTLNVYCVEVYALFTEGIENERDNVMSLHINRYDLHYRSALELALESDPSAGDVRERQNFVRFMNEAIDSLEDKERMLNMHSKKFNFFIKEKINTINIQNRKGLSMLDLDLNKLEFSEKMELLELLSKSETKPLEMKKPTAVDNSNDEEKIKELKTFEEKEVEDVDLDESMTFSEKQTRKVEEKEEEGAHDDWEVAKSIRGMYTKDVKKLDETLKKQRDEQNNSKE